MNHRSEGPERCPQKNSRVNRLPLCSSSSGCFSLEAPELGGGGSAAAALPTQHLHQFGIYTNYRLLPHPTPPPISATPPPHNLRGIVRKISLTRCWIHFFRPSSKNSSLGGENLLACNGCATPWTPFFPPRSAVTEVLNLRNPAGALSPPEAFWVSCRFKDWLLRTNTLTRWRNLSQSKMKKAAADTPS